MIPFGMGSEITRSVFTEQDFGEFHRRLANETSLLKSWCDDGQLDPTSGICGLELEAWLLDRNAEPSPCSDQFLFQVNDDLVVPELSRFNFEINAPPQVLGKNTLSNLEKSLRKTWSRCERAAEEINKQIISIGSLPTNREHLMTMDYMSPRQRYYALNEEMIRQREGEPIHLQIQGKEALDITRQDIMLEASTTSLQLHLQIALKESARFFNASQIISAPMVAISANSPFLFGKNLWAETRIATFEEAMSVNCFKDNAGNDIGRVNFGTGYVSETIFEPFQENLDKYPVLLPFWTDDETKDLHHLKLHNGTIWRWNRPVVGNNFDGHPHIRVEHRVMAATNSHIDTVASMALFLGMVYWMARLPEAPEKTFAFADAKENFYRAAKEGLAAKLKWFGKEVPVIELLQEQLLPAAKEALLKLDFSADEVEHYFDVGLSSRLVNRQNGSIWQQKFIEKNGPDFRAMTQAYIERQSQNLPVGEWLL